MIATDEFSQLQRLAALVRRCLRSATAGGSWPPECVKRLIWHSRHAILPDRWLCEDCRWQPRFRGD